MKTLIVAAALLAASVTTPAMSATAAATAAPAAAPVTIDEAAMLAPGDYVWRDPGQGAALSIVVSLPDQRAYVYRGNALVAVTTVSTGREGRETPVGSFPILQKAAMHRSTLYDSAEMPFMQRLTWDGVAIHAGSNPGFPTSHGCVHVPTAFARKLFAVTRIGTSVTVVDETIDGSPVDLTQPAPAPVETRAETASANAGQLAALASR